MKNIAIYLTMILLAKILPAQILPNQGFYKVRLVQEDKIVQAEINPAKPAKQIYNERLYYWYKPNQIEVTQGGFSGKLLNGYYEEFFRNKELMSQGSFKKGLKNGIWKSWQPGGKLLDVVCWKDGLKDGAYFYYDTAGKLKEDGFYRDGKLHGLRRVYNTTNGQAESMTYRKGQQEAKQPSLGFWNKLFKKAPTGEKPSVSGTHSNDEKKLQQKKAPKFNLFHKQKASALYIVIIISLVIAVICSSLIVAGSYYKLQYMQKNRMDALQNNLESGINLLLADDPLKYRQAHVLSLYNNQDDSISLKTTPWGLFDLALVKAFKQQDTLYKSFAIGYQPDPEKWAALYLTDQQRQLFVGGSTRIRGNAYLPKVGVAEAYVDGRKYEGGKNFVNGNIKTSKNKLPELASVGLKYFETVRNKRFGADSTLANRNIQVSFNRPVKSYYFKKRVHNLNNIRLRGNIILYAENEIRIDSSAELDNVLVFARSIKLGPGFKGRCQLFALDSIVVAPDCRLDYPSSVAVLNFKTGNVQPRIRIDSGSVVNGILLSWQKQETDGQTLIDIEKDVTVKGQVFAKGMVRFKQGARIDGSLSANKVVFEADATLYENYLVDTQIDAPSLSPYYLTSSLFWHASKKRKVLQWLDSY